MNDENRNEQMDQKQSPGTEDPTSHQAVVAAAAAEQRSVPTTAVEAADLADKYERMMRLADAFDDCGEEMRTRAQLGAEVINDPAFTESAELSQKSFAEAEEEIRNATSGKNGLLTRSIELDADALVLRATVLTYRWIDELQEAAYRTLGSIAGRAIGYLAPQVALGGAIVSAGLIETDALDRDGVAAYLNELADSNPELMEHVTSGGGGLLDGLQMRALLTVGVLDGERGELAGRQGRETVGIAELPTGFEAALRDVAAGFTGPEAAPAEADEAAVETSSTAPASITDLMTGLQTTTGPCTVQRVGEGRYIAFLGGADAANGRLRLVAAGDLGEYADAAVRAIEAATAGDEDPHVMLVGAGQGGVAAAEIATDTSERGFTVDQVVTAGAPSAQVPRIPEQIRVLSLEDRSDPIALLGSLINVGATNRITVVFDGRSSGENLYVAGGQAADGAGHPELAAEIDRIRGLGYLASA